VPDSTCHHTYDDADGWSFADYPKHAMLRERTSASPEAACRDGCIGKHKLNPQQQAGIIRLGLQKRQDGGPAPLVCSAPIRPQSRDSWPGLIGANGYIAQTAAIIEQAERREPLRTRPRG
jgi:hypothetical protein